MKPTHGLVPYTGIMPIEIYVDHTGPMTKNVKDNALMLEVIAGADGYDPRQYSPKTQKYTQGLEAGAKGMRIGIVKEGFGRPESEAASDEKVRKAIEVFKKLGATVEEVSIPEHLVGPGGVDADRHRRHCADHDVRRRLWLEQAGSLRHQPDRQTARLGAARQ